MLAIFVRIYKLGDDKYKLYQMYFFYISSGWWGIERDHKKWKIISQFKMLLMAWLRFDDSEIKTDLFQISAKSGRLSVASKLEKDPLY